MGDARSRGDIGFFPAIALGTLFVFYVVFAAMHDIAHGESDTTLEYATLTVSVPAFALLYWAALLHLPRGGRILWLGGTGFLLLLWDAGAVNAKLRPKYALDPMLASLFLSVGVPALALIAFHLTRGVCRKPRAAR